ncbi:hypothetical protein FZEAL_7656 [Fusarium zealandicum]|uniref:Uncharacterized protein n=1 Tax=Fusarium zealandicum TaxID=1053134 RepID=A0A8H4UG27_9HYPO|nr:hypothetical protein FZEAL_7656 [Fusarium zealandicum]
MPRADHTSKIADNLRQTDSAKARRDAIRPFYKALRRGDQFQPAWDAIGGALGLANLMAEFSLQDVRMLCKWLGCTASAENARPERRAALGELVKLLRSGSTDDRPLRAVYQDTVPACNLDVVKGWESHGVIKWTRSQMKRLFLGHREQYEEKFLNDVFSPDSADMRFATEKRLFRGNLSFCEKILTTILAKPGHKNVRIPFDFMDEFAMPLLKRLLKSRFDDETRNRYLYLVVQSIHKHKSSLTRQLNLLGGGVIQYTVQRWFEAPAGSETKGELTTYLVQLIELLQINEYPANMESVYSALLVSRKLNPEARYHLLRLLLRHMKGYGFDIEDDSESGLARLQKLPRKGDQWPAMLFFSIEPKKAVRLFNNLEKVYPQGNFLAPAPWSSTATIRRATKSPDEGGVGDVEVVRALLIRKSETGDEYPTWLDRARTLVHERKNKAQQSREPRQRVFWAKSSLDLCVAAGDLQLFGDTVIWARRFNKDPLTVKELYIEGTFEAKETVELLGAVPKYSEDTPEAVAVFTSLLVKEDIELANRILVNLLETATMSIQEPGFRSYDCQDVLRLPNAMADQRLRSLHKFFKSIAKCSSLDRVNRQEEMARLVWKSTMDTLIEAEALLRKPASRSLLGSRGNSEASGIYVFRKLSKTAISPPLLAELANFLLNQMRAHLGPETMRAQMGEVVEVVKYIANSDQPALAVPFIRDMVLDSDSSKDNSAWHRQLLSMTFISSLPAKAAKELLHSMAGGIKDKMREQNLRWPSVNKEPPKAETDASSEAKKPQQPAIKVTTVKMMAQLLENNLFVGPSSACNILISLLGEARHIDIVTTITSSLISAIKEPTCAPELRTRILDALEEYIVPVAARLNERRPLSEDDWTAAAADKAPLPAVSEETPLLELLVEQAQKAELTLDDKARLTQLIMGVLEQSAANNGRWMDLFLAKNNFTLDAGETLPKSPVNLNIFASLFRELMTYMPISICHMLHIMVITNIKPSPGIARITEAVKANRELFNSNAGGHWIAQFDNSGSLLFRLQLQHAAFALQSPAAEIESKVDKGVTASTLRDCLSVSGEQFVERGDPDMLYSLVAKLNQRRFDSRQHWESWSANCPPVIKQIMLKSETVRLRLRNNKETRVGNPIKLPNPFLLRIKTLHIPYSSPTEPASEEEEDYFVAELSAAIESLAKRRLPYHGDFALLKDELSKAPSAADLARLALKLARKPATEEPELVDYLLFEVVGELILARAEYKLDEVVVGELMELLRRWEGLEDEGLRAMGVQAVEKLRDLEGYSWFKEAK